MTFVNNQTPPEIDEDFTWELWNESKHSSEIHGKPVKHCDCREPRTYGGFYCFACKGYTCC